MGYRYRGLEGAEGAEPGKNQKYRESVHATAPQDLIQYTHACAARDGQRLAVLYFQIGGVGIRYRETVSCILKHRCISKLPAAFAFLLALLFPVMGFPQQSGEYK